MPLVGHSLSRRCDLLLPVLSSSLGVSVGTPLLVYHRGGKYQVCHLCGYAGVGVGDHYEVVHLPCRLYPVIGVGRILPRVAHVDPCPLDFSVLQVPHYLDDIGSNLGVYGAVRNSPYLLGDFPVLGIEYHHVCGQPVSEGSHFPCRSASRRLTG